MLPIPRSRFYKKERKRTLETFPKVKNKTTKSKQYLPTRNVAHFKKQFLQKRKRALETFPKVKQNNKKKKHLPTRNVAHSKKPFLQKRKKRTLETFPKVKNKTTKSKQYLPTQNVAHFKVQEPVSTKKKRTLLEMFLAKSFPSNSPTQEFLQKKKN